MGGELAEVADDEGQFVRDVVLFCQMFNLLDGCLGEGDFSDGGACDAFVGGKMKEFVSVGGSGIQADAVEGASRRSVGGVGFVVGLNTAAKRMLTLDVAI